MGGRRLRRIGAILLTVVGLSVIVALVAGEVVLVTTHGVSMEPRFHTGDLAVVVPAASYRVGEIVGYHSPLLHEIVLHRIVADHGGLFTFKGDNNSFLDPVRLPSSAIEGRLWLHVPRGGEVLGWVRSPVVLGLLAFLLIALGIGGETRRRRARGPVTGPGASGSGPKHAAPGAVGAGWWPVAVPMAIAGLFGILAVMAWAKPAQRPSERSLAFDQHVAFSYAGSAPTGTTYPDGIVTTGDPVFLHLVDALDVSARYTFAPGRLPEPARGRTGVAGTIGASAELVGPDGWSGPLGTEAPVAFSGTTARIDVALDLTRIPALEQAFSAETGMSLGDPQVVVTPVVHVTGTMGGTPVAAAFSAPLAFLVEGPVLDLASATPPATIGAPRGFPQLSQSRPGSVATSARATVHLAFLGRSVSVTGARRMALGGLLLSLLGAGAGWIWARRRRRMDETARIHSSHGHDLVSVSSSPAAQARLVVEVADFGALARLARRYDCMILELEHAGGHAYYVECGATIYRHGVEPAAGLRSVEDTGRPADLTYHVTALSSAS